MKNLKKISRYRIERFYSVESFDIFNLFFEKFDRVLEKGEREREKKKDCFRVRKVAVHNKKKKKRGGKKVCKGDIARSFNQVEREKLYALASRRITAADHCTKKSISHCGSKKLFELKAFPCATKLFLLDRRSTSFEQRNDIWCRLHLPITLSN